MFTVLKERELSEELSGQDDRDYLPMTGGGLLCDLCSPMLNLIQNAWDLSFTVDSLVLAVLSFFKLSGKIPELVRGQVPKQWNLLKLLNCRRG